MNIRNNPRHRSFQHFLPTRSNQHKLKPGYLALMLALAEFSHADTAPEDNTDQAQAAQSAPTLLAFNTNFLNGQGRQADLSAVLEAGNDILPGTYRVDIQVNGDWVGRQDIVFQQDTGSRKVSACLNAALLQDFGVNLNALALSADDPACLDLPKLMPQASVDYNASRLQLNLSIPQAFLSRSARGYIDPSLWDEGVTAGYVNYQFSGNYSHASGGQDSESYYLGLQNGINLGAWRLRNETSLSWDDGQALDVRSNRTLLQRDVTSLKSQLTLGEQYSNATLFDSLRFRGAQLASDDGMLPDSERGYAPVIRGQALSNATVEIRQNNYMLYRANVPPGPFELSDIYPSGSNGDLEITVIEADGSKRVTHQAFSSLPLMLRKGRWQYNIAVGQYQGGQAANPSLATGSLVFGLNDDSTIASGFQYSSDFQAINLGVGTNTPLGALSLDITQSSSRTHGQRQQGQSVRILYAKTFTRTLTNLTLAAYRYSTSGYRSFNDHVNDSAQTTTSLNGRTRSRIDLTTQQDLGRERRFGSISLNLSQQSYWGQSGSTRSVSASYGNSWKRLSYNVSFSQNRDSRPGGVTSNQVTLTLSMPLGNKQRSPQLYANAGRNNDGGLNVQTGVSAYFNDQTSYSIQAGHDSQNHSSTGSFSVNHTADFVQLSAAYNAARNYQSGSVGASGAIVAHAGGINLSRTVGDTFALLQVEGIKNKKLQADSGGSAFASNGYAVQPNAQPYRLNRLGLETRKLGADVELEDTIKQVVPRRGAIVKARFKARSGQRVRFEVLHAKGALPLGARVEDQKGKQLGIIDPFGKTLLLLQQKQGQLTVKWKNQQCVADYKLPPAKPGQYYLRQTIQCR